LTPLDNQTRMFRQLDENVWITQWECSDNQTRVFRQ